VDQWCTTALHIVMSEMGIVVLVVVIALIGLPAYIVGKRCDVLQPWVAFVPFVGYWIVLLRAVWTSAWWTLVALTPAGIFLYVWLAFVMPIRHYRSGWWTAALIFLPVIGLYWYALTLQPRQKQKPKVVFAKLPS
jgi:hypothetical protein